MNRTIEDGTEYPIRLNRYIASCGVSSRRGADELIASGSVKVDGVVVTAPGTILHAPSRVEIDGREISTKPLVYIAMNKPRGVLSAVRDKRDRTVIDLLPPRLKELGVFPVGRLDKDSEGLIILTNDGEFAQSVLHPSNGVRRTYDVTLERPVNDMYLEKWRRGTEIEGRMARPISVDRMSAHELRVVLGEGFKREIRLIARALGNRVSKLKRIAFGDFYIQKLPSGGICEYNNREIIELIFGGHAVNATPTGIGRKLQDVSEG